MKIIVLCGPSRYGKTSTLKKLIEDLKKEGVEIEKLTNRHGDGDVRVVIEWRGRRVGVCTGGDDKPIITENFQFLRGNACDIGLTGLRINNRQWKLYRTLIKCCEPEIPQFVWKMSNGDVKDSKWADVNVDVDSVVVSQMKVMLEHEVSKR